MEMDLREEWGVGSKSRERRGGRREMEGYARW